jgi:hypothetical protein
MDTMAIGIITRSAELMKLAIEHSAMMRDGLFSIAPEFIVCKVHDFTLDEDEWAISVHFGLILQQL